MSVSARIASALAASAFGQAVTIGSQIVLTPLYFKFWGVALYGEWLILSSIPAYLTMADLGIGSAAGNEMTMRAGSGDRVGAQQSFRGALWVSMLAGMVVVLIGGAAAAVALRWQIPSTPSLTPEVAAGVLFVLACHVGLGFAGGVVSAGFRCAERNSQGIVLANVARLAEVVAVCVLLLAGRGPLAVCLGILGVKVVALWAQWLILSRVCRWLFSPRAPTDRRIAARLLKPAIAFLAFPLGNALALQGPILIIGATLGGPAVAMFSAMRTLARVPLQLTTMINASVWPEMSRAFGAGDAALLRRLHQATLGATVLLTGALGLALVALGRPIVHLWLGRETTFDAFVFASLVVLTLMASAWGASAVVLAAINAHLRLGIVIIGVEALGIAAAATLASSAGWPGILAPLVLAEAALFLWVWGHVLRLTGDTPRAFVSHFFSETRQRVGRLLRR